MEILCSLVVVFFVQSRRYGALAVSMQTSVALYKPWGEGAVPLQLFVLQ